MARKILKRPRREVSVRQRNLDLFDGPFGGIYAFYSMLARARATAGSGCFAYFSATVVT
jgi:hypothetical protein